jgi:CBS domain-containing protein
VYTFLQQTTDKYMTGRVKSVTRDVSVLELSEMFEQDDYNTYPVLEDAQVVGIVTKFDILKCFAFTPSQMVPRYAELMNRRVADILTAEFIYVRPDTRLSRVLQLMVQHRIRSILVLENEELVGIIAREDVIAALKATARD